MSGEILQFLCMSEACLSMPVLLLTDKFQGAADNTLKNGSHSSSPQQPIHLSVSLLPLLLDSIMWYDITPSVVWKPGSAVENRKALWVYENKKGEGE